MDHGRSGRDPCAGIVGENPRGVKPNHRDGRAHGFCQVGLPSRTRTLSQPESVDAPADRLDSTPMEVVSLVVTWLPQPFDRLALYRC